MKILKFFLKPVGFLPLLLLVVGLAVWQLGYYSGDWRYKITVAVETPEGLKAGSAVREVRISDVDPHLRPLESLPHIRVRGEAVVIDLGARGVLYAIMDTDGSYRHVFDAFPYTRPLSREGIAYYDKLKAGTASLPPNQYPMFVSFADPQEPKTVMKVDPKNLEETFGHGVRLKDITIEITNESITQKIYAILPWLGNMRSNIDGTSTTVSGALSNNLHVGNFSKNYK